MPNSSVQDLRQTTNWNQVMRAESTKGTSPYTSTYELRIGILKYLYETDFQMDQYMTLGTWLACIKMREHFRQRILLRGKVHHFMKDGDNLLCVKRGYRLPDATH